jgi:hypothetical protein
MHSHKNTPVPRWLNCAPMHLQSQIQPLMAPTCMNASLHTQNALNQLKWSVLLTHSKCIQPTEIKCSPYTLRMHSTNWNQGLSLHTQNALSQLKWSALLTHSQCIQPTQIKTYNAGMWTHAHPMLRNTSKEHQSSLCAPPNSRWPPKFFKTPPRLQKRLQEPSRTETCTSNKHKTSRSLLMHTSNETSNHASHMSGPITCWKQ